MTAPLVSVGYLDRFRNSLIVHWSYARNAPPLNCEVRPDGGPGEVTGHEGEQRQSGNSVDPPLWVWSRKGSRTLWIHLVVFMSSLLISGWHDGLKMSRARNGRYTTKWQSNAIAGCWPTCHYRFMCLLAQAPTRVLYLSWNRVVSLKCNTLRITNHRIIKDRHSWFRRRKERWPSP